MLVDDNFIKKTQPTVDFISLVLPQHAILAQSIGDINALIKQLELIVTTAQAHIDRLKEMED